MMTTAKKAPAAKKATSVGGAAKKATAKAAQPARKVTRPAPQTSPGKSQVVTVIPASTKWGKTTVTVSANGVLKATTTSASGRETTFDLSRRKLVDKYPDIKPRPAPKSVLKLDEETRRSLLASMLLK
ncbi:hypothetical protein [Bordetella ansorpii]|uniref:hypothetical protein n=1 Tax=Bordetella ansorpii TaxID=288768 RepID=UPI000ACBD9DF|nr:hypothetical protein [Bordetella ansorpii]